MGRFFFPKSLLDYPSNPILFCCPRGVFELPFSLDVCILMRTRNGSRNSNPQVCSFTLQMYVLLGKVGLTKIGNSPFDLSVTRVENPKISKHLHIQEKQQNVTISTLYYSLWFWQFNQCKLYWGGYFAWRTDCWKKRKDFSKQFIFNLEIYLHLPDVGTTLVQYFFFFLDPAAFNSIQTNFLSLIRTWPWVLGQVWKWGAFF